MTYFLIVNGILIHVFVLFAVLSAYFESPIVNGIIPIKSKISMPADRLVMFIAHGLRFDAFITKINESLYEVDTDIVPYLSELSRTRASWGKSITGIPTESRPSRVALAAGFSEDPSSVFTRWKQNIAEFDTIFNESSYTWAWGNINTISMFTKGSSENHVDSDCYDSEEMQLGYRDYFVFEKVKDFFKEARSNTHLFNKLIQRKTIFYLDLPEIGTIADITTAQFYGTCIALDDGIKETEKIFNDFYGDNKTVFLLTSDHGMTERGSHGSGSPLETNTPIIAWGAGVRASKNQQNDINQVDIAPLMSTLISVPVPVNSLGILPIHYLNLSENESSLVLYASIAQLIAQFNEKEKYIKQNTWSLMFDPFSKLNKNILQKYFARASEALPKENCQEAIKIYKEFAKLLVEGFDYYQKLHRNSLLFLTTLSYVGWILLLITNILDPHFDKCYKNSTCNVLFIGITIFVLFFVNSGSSIILYLHVIMPIYMWWCVAISNVRYIETFMIKFKKVDHKILYFLLSVLYLIGTEALMYTFIDRCAISIVLIGTSVWPYFTKSNQLSNMIKAFWTINSIVLAIFPFSPIGGSEINIKLLLIFGLILFLIESACIRVISIWKVLMIVTLVNIYLIDKNLDPKLAMTPDYAHLPVRNQFVSWMVFVVSLCLPLSGSLFVADRLQKISSTFFITTLMLSVSYEPIFTCLYFLHLYTWLNIEFGLENKNSINDLTFTKRQAKTTSLADEFRRAYFFLFFCLLGLFGTNDISNLYDFKPEWVRNFLKTFSPFTMGALVMIKIFIPLVVASCHLRAVAVATNSSIRRIFIITLFFVDVIGIHLMFSVKNQGTWREIDLSLIQFIIIDIFVVILFGFYHLSSYFTSKTLNCSKIIIRFKSFV